MAIHALTIDFWNTMVVARTNGRQRHQQRVDHLLGVAHASRPEITEETVRAAFREAIRRFDQAWRQQHCTPTTSELVHSIWDELGLTVEESRHHDIVHVFQEGVLSEPPDFVEGLEEALHWAAGRYQLGIISDTMFSPGRVIRRLLDQRGLLRFFDALVFSDETGFAKPDVRAFEQAGQRFGTAPRDIAHIGDLRRTDVAGARDAGLIPILFTGVHEDTDPEPAPDAVLPGWHALPDLLKQIDY
ncbi:MAG: HAD family hydrolase [Rhodothermales bacterium]